MADGYLNHCKTCHNEAVKRRQRSPAYRKYHAKWRAKNRKKLNAYSRDWNKQNWERVLEVQRASYLFKTYKITQAQYDEMLKRQRGRCALCRSTPKAKLGVDHCHRTGHVRGLLCGSCNRGLGLFHDNPRTLRRALAYLGFQIIPK